MGDLTLERTPTGEVPRLPSPRGPLSDEMLRLLRGGFPRRPVSSPDDHPADDRLAAVDPLGDDDLHLALYLAYELHYRGLPGVREDLEWDLRVLGLRRVLESAFEDALHGAVAHGEVDPGGIGELLRGIAAPPDGNSLSAFLEREATLEQAREFLIHRSAYQLKEADPHSWVIPRLEGAAKTTVMDIQYDEYGSGDPAWMHAELFRTTMIAAGLDGSYGAYVDRLPGSTLATVNLISLFGLHRRWRGALVGHLAIFEMTSTLPNRAFGHGFRRLGFDAEATRFFDEHVEADSVHELLASDLAVSLVAREPALAADVVFGARALAALEDRSSRHLLGAWRAGVPTLLPSGVER
jgi:hypothetical protein